jgi:hypothetical protein
VIQKIQLLQAKNFGGVLVIVVGYFVACRRCTEAVKRFKPLLSPYGPDKETQQRTNLHILLIVRDWD